MAQSLFAGATEYEHQSLEDILTDIENWIELINKTKSICTVNIRELKETNYWNMVYDDFKISITRALNHFDTVISDIKRISTGIKNDNIKSVHIKLLQQITKQSSENEKYISKSWHSTDRWKEYGNSNFIKVELLYTEIKGTVCTLLDASNMAMRLKDYMGDETQMKNQFIFNGDVSQSNIGNTNSNGSSSIINISSGEDIKKLFEIFMNNIKNSSLDNLEKDDIEEAVQRIKKLNEEEKSPRIIDKIKEKLTIVEKIVTKGKSMGTLTLECIEVFDKVKDCF